MKNIITNKVLRYATNVWSIVPKNQPPDATFWKAEVDVQGRKFLFCTQNPDRTSPCARLVQSGLVDHREFLWVIDKANTKRPYVCLYVGLTAWKGNRLYWNKDWSSTGWNEIGRAMSRIAAQYKDNLSAREEVTLAEKRRAELGAKLYLSPAELAEWETIN